MKWPLSPDHISLRTQAYFRSSLLGYSFVGIVCCLCRWPRGDGSRWLQSSPDLTNKQTKKQILVVTVVFCFEAFQTFFDSIKLRFICQSRSQESLLPLEGSVSNDDGDGSKNVAKKVNWDPFKLNRVHLDPFNLFPLVDWKHKKEGRVRKPLFEKAYSCQPREHKSLELLCQPTIHVRVY